MIRRYTTRKSPSEVQDNNPKILKKNNNVVRNEEEHLRLRMWSVIVVTRQRYRLLQRLLQY